MIAIFDKFETDFAHNGIGVMIVTEATVSEELNGEFELTLTAPTNIAHKRWQAGALTEGNVIRCPTPRGLQLFRIYATDTIIDGTVTVQARHVFYDAIHNFTNAIGTGDAGDAIRTVYDSTTYEHPFIVDSDITDVASFAYERTNPVNAVLGEGGLCQLFSAELYRDNFHVSLRRSIGENRGFQIRYRKNMVGLNLQSSIETVATRIFPYTTDDDDNIVTLPELYVDSPNIGLYAFPLMVSIEHSDLRIGRDDWTVETAREEMRKRAQDFFASGGDLPTVNATVDFVLLRDTANYAQFAPLEAIYLGDTVTAIHDDLGVDLTAECIRYEFDAILERYTEIELGDFIEDYARLTTIAIESAYVGNSVVSSDITNLIRKLSTHAHTGEDGTVKIKAKDIDNEPEPTT